MVADPCRSSKTEVRVGTLIALTYMLTLEDAQRFRKSRDVGCYVGLQAGTAELGAERAAAAHQQGRRSVFTNAAGAGSAPHFGAVWSGQRATGAGNNDDADTGSKSACEDQNGGTWFNGSPSDWNLSADWSGQGNALVAAFAQAINPSVGNFGDPSETPDVSALATFVSIAATTTSLPGQIPSAAVDWSTAEVGLEYCRGI
jgi:hypothetical protein